MWLWMWLIPFASAQLDLSAIKKQQTYPSGTVTVPTTTVGPCNKMLDVLTQETAEQECVAFGAHLASFETSEQATAVKTLVLDAPLFSDDLLSFISSSQESWIGLSKEAEGAWTWTDSSSVEFTNLPAGTSVSGASCVAINSTGTWQPTACSSTAPSFICKREAAS
ncbi:unnamed protein product [Caenorhabditis sp. 36 PRJEB53466]|nr:unnamed protein product [Caenorhabditis sp. 36 PRJEB53466]